MFNSENWQIKLVYAGLGGFLMLIGMLLSPVTAKRDKFGEIECTKLTIVNSEGNSRVILGTDYLGTGFATVYGIFGKPRVSLSAHGYSGDQGGQLTINNMEGDELVRIGTSQFSLNHKAGQMTIHNYGWPEPRKLDFDSGVPGNQITITNKNTPDQPSVSLSVTPLGSSVKADLFYK